MAERPWTARRRRGRGATRPDVRIRRKGVRATARGTKAAGAAVADTAGDAKDATVKGAKKSGNWLSRGFKKIGSVFND